MPLLETLVGVAMVVALMLVGDVVARVASDVAAMLGPL